MSFLSREVPAGGRHVARPAAAPVAPATTRLRQLLPVGLLVAASSAGAATAPLLGGAATAKDGDTGRATGHTTSEAAPLQAGVTLTPMTNAAFVLPHAGKHRAAGQARTTSGTLGSGKHRADDTQAAGSTSAGHSSTTTSSKPASKPASSSAGSASGAGADATRTSGSSAPASATTPLSSTSASSPTGSSTTTSTGSATGSGDLLGTVTGVVGGVVGGLLGGS